ncbi:Cadmium/zinc-transporting ATPase HMA2, partial [Ananas comosus]
MGGNETGESTTTSTATATTTTREVKYQKSYFDVLGICCPSEVPLVEKILRPLEGVQKVSVIVPSKTVIVVHDGSLISPVQIGSKPSPARSLDSSLRGRQNHQQMAEPVYNCERSAASRLAVQAILPSPAMASLGSSRDWAAADSIEKHRRHSEINSGYQHSLTDCSMAPQKAVLAETGQVVDARDVKINTVLAVKAGEVIPIDSVVIDGRSEVDERSLTGESFPVAKQPNSQVWAGTLNINGYISVRTTAMAENSAVAKMARLVEEAQNSRSKTQRLIDSCTKYYTPAVVCLAVGVALVPLITRIWSHKIVRNPKGWYQLALVLLVSACPCALVLSTPVATFCALLKAARTGLLIKGGDVLETLAKIRVVAFDKTGTITKGEFDVRELKTVQSEVSLHTLLYWVSSIESKSSHPMASALVDYARSNSVEPKPENVAEFHIYPGEGIYGKIDGKDIYRISNRLILKILVTNMDDKEGGVTIGYVISDSVLVGVFTLSDTCRTGSAKAINDLKSLGIKSVMLTGDSTAAATHAQDQLERALEELHAELLPEDKVQIVSELKTKEGPTLMVGDGMNDAPALAMADVGISMGISGSAVAMETSHITLMSNDIGKIPKVIRLAKRTHFKIIENIIFSIITKVAIVALAFAGHPLLWAAVLADVGTCLLVILNSMTLLRETTRKGKKCCGSSHKSLVKRTDHAGHCANGACTTSSTRGQIKTSSCSDKHICHENEKVEVGKRVCHIESPNHVHCCHEQVKDTRNASQENLISISSELGHHGDDCLHEEHLEKHHDTCNHVLDDDDHDDDSWISSKAKLQIFISTIHAKLKH